MKPVVLFHANLSSRDQCLRDGKQPGFATAVPTPIDGMFLRVEVRFSAQKWLPQSLS